MSSEKTIHCRSLEQKIFFTNIKLKLFCIKQRPFGFYFYVENEHIFNGSCQPFSVNCTAKKKKEKY